MLLARVRILVEDVALVPACFKFKHSAAFSVEKTSDDTSLSQLDIVHMQLLPAIVMLAIN